VFLMVPALDRNGSVSGLATGTITFDELSYVAALASGARGVRISVEPEAPKATPPADGDDVGAIAEPDVPNEDVFDFGGRTWTVAVPPDAGGSPLGAWLVVLVVSAGLATTAAVAAYLYGRGKT